MKNDLILANSYHCCSFQPNLRGTDVQTSPSGFGRIGVAEPPFLLPGPARLLGPAAPVDHLDLNLGPLLIGHQ